MFLSNLKISNFRGLSEIDVTFKQSASVIVGPNAVGKTSIFEAIRLAKAVLSPRIFNDADATLTDMGVFSNNVLKYEALAGDVSKPVDVCLTIQLSQSDVAELQKNENQIAVFHLRNKHGISPNTSNLQLAQFLSSHAGKAALQAATKEVKEKLSSVGKQPEVRLHLTVSGPSGPIQGEDLFSQEIIGALEGSLPPSESLLSYFPADRAMPTGDVNVQLGSNESQAQLVSHLTNPATKYNRLKQVIVTQMLIGTDAATKLKDDFHAIFENLLIGKQLKGLSLNKYGAVSVLIEEKVSGKVYDIDRMSSGEKGVILLFLLMRRSIHKGGILMIDEPELHLNPAVCKNLLPFLIEYVAKPENLQVLICSHSAEILGTAFDREDCHLLHFRSGRDISPIYKEDKREVFEALRRLGASTSDVLFSKGTIFVEGIHDCEVLDVGFARLNGYKIMPLRGREEIVKEIKMLQSAERNSKLGERQYFVFDHDRKPSGIESSEFVKVVQWDRYCFENYLLEPDAIYDVCVKLKGDWMTETRGSLLGVLKEMAMKQLKGVVLRQVYASLEPENAGLRSSEIQDLETYGEMAEKLFSRIKVIRDQVKDLVDAQWCEEISRRCNEKESELRPIWEGEWQSLCDGKRVLLALHHSLKLNISLLDFKKRIVEAMASRTSDNWRGVDSLLSELIGT